MVTSLIICGSGSLPRQEQQEEEDNRRERSIQSAGSSPRRSSRSGRSHHHNHHKNNPYATRGLDKFSALLAEIEEKKQMIYSENNPDEICFVQFDYSKDNNCKPVVVKVKPSHPKAKKKRKNDQDLNVVNASTTSSRMGLIGNNEPMDNNKAKMKKGLLRRLKLQSLRKPSCYLPAMLILILIFLTLFGRSVTILCTSICWYAIPTISKWNSDSTSKKRRNF